MNFKCLWNEYSLFGYRHRLCVNVRNRDTGFATGLRSCAKGSIAGHFRFKIDLQRNRFDINMDPKLNDMRCKSAGLCVNFVKMYSLYL
jgi:hypothetical protein